MIYRAAGAVGMVLLIVAGVCAVAALCGLDAADGSLRATAILLGVAASCGILGGALVRWGLVWCQRKELPY